MKTASIDSQQILESLRLAVSRALEKKKRLGQYAVIWEDNKPVILKDDFLQFSDKAEQ